MRVQAFFVLRSEESTKSQLKIQLLIFHGCMYKLFSRNSFFFMYKIFKFECKLRMPSCQSKIYKKRKFLCNLL